MKKENLNEAQLHSAGATIRHKSPFAELVSYRNKTETSQEFRNEWIIPFYFELNNQSEEWIKRMIQLKPRINEEIILKSLGEFDWRPRSTGSYFAAIKRSIHLEDIIGTHLLKSEVCYAGSEYAITLATFNTPKAIDYFDRYLSYYLKQPQLYFDQDSVMIALKYLDEVNNTNYSEKHLKNWEDLLTWRYQDQIERLEALKSFAPEKIEKINRTINEIEPVDTSIDTEFFKEHITILNRIICG